MFKLIAVDKWFGFCRPFQILFFLLTLLSLVKKFSLKLFHLNTCVYLNMSTGISGKNMFNFAFYLNSEGTLQILFLSQPINNQLMNWPGQGNTCILSLPWYVYRNIITVCVYECWYIYNVKMKRQSGKNLLQENLSSWI